MKKRSLLFVMLLTGIGLMVFATETRALMMGVLPTDFFIKTFEIEEKDELVGRFLDLNPKKEFLFVDFNPGSADLESLDFSGFDRDNKSMADFDEPFIMVVEIPDYIFTLSPNDKEDQIKKRIESISQFYGQDPGKEFLFLDYDPESTENQPVDTSGFVIGDTFQMIPWIESSTGWEFDGLPSSPVPEPATILLIGTGLVGFAGTRIRKRFKK